MHHILMPNHQGYFVRSTPLIVGQHRAQQKRLPACPEKVKYHVRQVNLQIHLPEQSGDKKERLFNNHIWMSLGVHILLAMQCTVHEKFVLSLIAIFFFFFALNRLMHFANCSQKGVNF